MALIYLLPVDDASKVAAYPQERLINSFNNDVHKKHSITQNRQEADLLLYWYNFERYKLRSFKLSKEERKKLIVYNGTDIFYAIVWNGYKTLTPSWPSSVYSNGFSLGWDYYHMGSSMQNLVNLEHSEDYKYVWSFMGSVHTSPLRKKIAELNSTNSYFKDTSAQFKSGITSKVNSAELKKYHEDYINILKDSAFVLCPRGLSPSSIRLFEVMKSGRVPVIISDAWLPPPFIDWKKCSIWIKEDEIHLIPQILGAKLGKAKEMGLKAREEWEKVFAESNMFHYTTEAALLLKTESKHFNRFNYAKSLLLYVFKTKTIGSFFKEFYRVNFKVETND